MKPARVAESLNMYILVTEINMISIPDLGLGIFSFLHVNH